MADRHEQFEPALGYGSAEVEPEFTLADWADAVINHDKLEGRDAEGRHMFDFSWPDEALNKYLLQKHYLKGGTEITYTLFVTPSNPEVYDEKYDYNATTDTITLRYNGMDSNEIDIPEEELRQEMLAYLQTANRPPAPRRSKAYMDHAFRELMNVNEIEWPILIPAVDPANGNSELPVAPPLTGGDRVQEDKPSRLYRVLKSMKVWFRYI